MKKFTKVIVWVIWGFLSCTFKTAGAQNSACDGVRYKEECFATETIHREQNVIYGSNYTLNNNFVNLKMDVYYSNIDTMSKKAMIVLVHGGGYIMGGKNTIVTPSIFLAKRGYLVATINYRMIDVPLNDSLTMQHNMIKTMGDTKAAIRFFIEDARFANIYKVDTTNIFLAGMSSGGWTVLHTAYLNQDDDIPGYWLDYINADGGFAGSSSSNTHINTPVKGVVSLSGALFNRNWISPGEPPLYIVHETGDTLCPCYHGCNSYFDFPLEMYGGCTMERWAIEAGIYNKALFYETSGHGGYLLSEVYTDFTSFLQSIICQDTSENEYLNHLDYGWRISPNPVSLVVKIVRTYNSETTITIMNELGYIVYSSKFKKELNVDVSKLEPGIYFVKLGDNPKCQKIVKI
jgi:acetyl esterase/lipase